MSATKKNETLNRLNRSLFFLGSDRLEDALSRLPVGILWKTCLPGMDVGMALSMLGEDPLTSFRLVASACVGGDGDFIGEMVGLPFQLDTSISLDPLGLALFNDGQALLAIEKDVQAAKMAEDSQRWVVELGHKPRSAWLAMIHDCLDHAARQVFVGNYLDPLDALLLTDDTDLRPVIPFVDFDTRSRFMQAVFEAYDAPSRMKAFSNSHYRRGAAAGMLKAVFKTLEKPGDGESGCDEHGWPAWWIGTGADLTSILSRLPPGLVTEAASMKSFQSR